MQMTSTLYGFEQYMNKRNTSLFSDIELPTGIDKTTLVNTILVESGEMESIYTNPDFIKTAINTWFKRKHNMLERWASAISATYNPIYNYDRTEEASDKTNITENVNNTKNETTQSSSSGSESTGISSENTTKNTGTDSTAIDNTNTNTKDLTDTTTNNTTNTIGAQNNTVENKKSAYNSSSYEPYDKSEESVGNRSDSVTENGSVTYTGTDKNVLDSDTVRTLNTKTETNSETEANKHHNNSGNTSVNGTGSSTKTGSNNLTHNMRAYGNIGVTTTQKLLEEEFELWGRVDIYKDTADLFVQDFCILVL